MPTPPSPPLPGPKPDSSRQLIEGYRKELDRIQANLVSLLDLRLQVARSVAELKAEAGIALYDADREREILESLDSGNRSEHGCTAEHLQAVFRCVLEQTRSQIAQEP